MLKSNAKIEEIDGSTEDDPKYSYTIQLRAKYGPKDSPTPTHITWYSNNGKDESVNESSDLKINEAVNVRPADTFNYEGHRFIGWSRFPADVGPESPTDRTNLWLEYRDGNFYNGDTLVTQIAADEKTPYHNLYAVWEPLYYPITITKTFDGVTKEQIEASGFKINYSGSVSGELNFKNTEKVEDLQYTWTISAPYHTNVKFTEENYKIGNYNVITDGTSKEIEEVHIQNNKVDFVNRYTTNEVSVNTETAKLVTKTVTGEGFAETSFSFTIEPEGEAPAVEEGKETASLTFTEKGTQAVDFGTITFDKAGTYTYTVKETTQATTGWTNDNDPKTVTVVVEDENGQLKATVTEDPGPTPTPTPPTPTPVPQPTPPAPAPTVTPVVEQTQGVLGAIRDIIAEEGVAGVIRNPERVLGATRFVQTGDDSAMVIYLVIALAAMAGLGGWFIAAKKRQKKENGAK